MKWVVSSIYSNFICLWAGLHCHHLGICMYQSSHCWCVPAFPHCLLCCSFSYIQILLHWRTAALLGSSFPTSRFTKRIWMWHINMIFVFLLCLWKHTHFHTVIALHLRTVHTHYKGVFQTWRVSSDVDSVCVGVGCDKEAVRVAAEALCVCVCVSSDVVGNTKSMWERGWREDRRLFVCLLLYVTLLIRGKLKSDNDAPDTPNLNVLPE